MVWEFVFLMVILKIPVIYLCLVVYWALRGDGRPAEPAPLLASPCRHRRRLSRRARNRRCAALACLSPDPPRSLRDHHRLRRNRDRWAPCPAGRRRGRRRERMLHPRDGYRDPHAPPALLARKPLLQH